MKDETIQPQNLNKDGDDYKPWLDQEIEEMKQEGNKEYKTLPGLKLEENKVTEFEIDFSEPFGKWLDEKGVVKKIIPVTCKGEKMNFWLSTRNPLYKQIIEAGKNGQKVFKVMRTGQKAQTRYTLVKE